jgi:hypothetical protein
LLLLLFLVVDTNVLVVVVVVVVIVVVVIVFGVTVATIINLGMMAVKGFLAMTVSTTTGDDCWVV